MTVLVDSLPPHRLNIDHEVKIKGGETPSWGRFDKTLSKRLMVMKEWLEESMATGFFQQSSSLQCRYLSVHNGT